MAENKEESNITCCFPHVSQLLCLFILWSRRWLVCLAKSDNWPNRLYMAAVNTIEDLCGCAFSTTAEVNIRWISETGLCLLQYLLLMKKEYVEHKPYSSLWISLNTPVWRKLRCHTPNPSGEYMWAVSNVHRDEGNPHTPLSVSVFVSWNDLLGPQGCHCQWIQPKLIEKVSLDMHHAGGDQ